MTAYRNSLRPSPELRADRCPPPPPRVRGSTRAMASTQPRIVLVETVRSFAAQYFADVIPEAALAAFGDRAVYLHDLAFEGTLFDVIPETTATDENAEEILGALDQFTEEYDDDLADLVGGAPAEGWERGLHLDATYDQVVEAFKKDGFEVRPISF